MKLLLYTFLLALPLLPVRAASPAPPARPNAPVVDLVELSKHKEQWPENVMLTRDIMWAIPGQTTPTSYLPKLTEVPLIAVQGNEVVVGVGEDIKAIPVSATDLIVRVQILHERKVRAGGGDDFDAVLNQIDSGVKRKYRAKPSDIATTATAAQPAATNDVIGVPGFSLAPQPARKLSD